MLTKKYRRIKACSDFIIIQVSNFRARRLHTLLEKLLEDVSFNAPDLEDKNVVIDTEYVNKALQDIVVNQDLTQFIL